MCYCLSSSAGKRHDSAHLSLQQDSRESDLCGHGRESSALSQALCGRGGEHRSRERSRDHGGLAQRQSPGIAGRRRRGHAGPRGDRV